MINWLSLLAVSSFALLPSDQAHPDTAEAQWKAWKSEYIENFRSSPTSLFRVLDGIQLKTGETAYLDTRKATASKWTRSLPAKGSGKVVSVHFDGHQLRLTNGSATPTDLLKTENWRGPNGLLVAPGKLRNNYILVYLYGPQSQFDETRVPFFEFNSKWVVQARVTPSKDKQEQRFVTSRGNERIQIKYGTAEFQVDGKKFALDLYASSDDFSKLFLPFRDQTNGKFTYGGGRYLDVLNQVRDQGTVLIDFNRAYNPYCVYSKFFDCAVIDGNRIDANVEAGAKMPNK